MDWKNLYQVGEMNRKVPCLKQLRSFKMIYLQFQDRGSLFENSFNTHGDYAFRESNPEIKYLKWNIYYDKLRTEFLRVDESTICIRTGEFRTDSNWLLSTDHKLTVLPRLTIKNTHERCTLKLFLTSNKI